MGTSQTAPISFGSSASFTPPKVLAPGDYTWKVQASDGQLTSGWSTQPFTVDNNGTPAVPIDLQTAATDTTEPLLSGVVHNQGEDNLTGNIYLTDASGKAVIASPTATGTVPSGTRVTYRIPDGTLTPGVTYHWNMTACLGSSCSAASPTQTFTAASSGPPAPPTPPADAVTTTWHTADLAPIDAMSDPSGCSGVNCPVSTAVSTLQVGGDGSAHWVSAVKPDLSAIPTGSTVYNATLTLTKTGCLGDCGSDTFTVDAASSDVGSATDGVSLAQSDDTDQSFNTGPETDTTVDVTDALSSWIGGDTDTGFVLAATDPTTATGGATFTAALRSPTPPLPHPPPFTPPAAMVALPVREIRARLVPLQQY